MTTEGSRFLSELDQALRRHAEPERQHEALSHVAEFLQRHEESMMVSFVFLKLADFFRDGNNRLRAYIMQTFDKCRPLMHSVRNLDELARRILIVIGSDDTVARSISFRVLGSFASVAHERLDIRHCISTFLVAQRAWSVEFESIVYAAGEVACFSLAFSRQLFELLVHISVRSDCSRLVKSIALQRLPAMLATDAELQEQVSQLAKRAL